MIGVPDVSTDEDSFSSSRQHFETVISFLDSKDSFELEHAELEEHLEETSRELFRRLFQDHLSLRAQREQRIATVVDSSGILRRSVEARHARTLSTVFGEVEVERLAYRQRGQENLHPADALLNLPKERHSHGLRRWAAIEASRGSFDSAKDAIARATRQGMGKRQIESLVGLAASDVDAFYAERSAPGCDSGDVLVLSVDSKGIVMRPEALREATRRAAQGSSTKLKTRLSKGEKRGRKRMAELGAVYDTTPIPRNATDVLAIKDEEPVPGPSAKHKWLTVSVVEDVAAVFDEAERRDEKHQRTWVALVDGNDHQIDRIETEGRQRELDVTILIDLIHVLEYLWTAACCFFDQGNPTAEVWVRDRVLGILNGGARDVAAGIRRRASSERLKTSDRKGADDCASYLINKAAYLDYPRALTQGWPIAT